ncbi:MAG: histidine triad family protein [Chloroflexota bacterium]|nr:histidine triad family protein [Chloroflexota bacterium]
MADECIFCGIVNGDIPAKVVYRDDEVVAFEDIKPVAPVHLLVIPTRHVASVRDLTRDDDAMLGKLIETANSLAREHGIHDQGFRLNVNAGPNGGQTVYHLHVHVIGGRFMTWPPG